MANKDEVAQDPRRVAFIAVRTGSGKPSSDAENGAEAIVVGEVPVLADEIVDPDDHPECVWQWRYCLLKLADLERLLAQSSRLASQATSWRDIPHPLDGLGAVENAYYYYDGNAVAPGAVAMLSKAESAALVRSNDLPQKIKDKLTDTIRPFIDDALTPSAQPVPRLNFAIPLRNVVRVAIYEKDRQPFRASEATPIIVLDTCHNVDPKGNSVPDRPTGPVSAEGSCIVLVTDPTAVDKTGSHKNLRTSATGKLAAVSLQLQVRLPLNAHDSPGGTLRNLGLMRFHAARASEQRDRQSLFATPKTPSGAFGPYFDGIRLGFTYAQNHDPVLSQGGQSGYMSELATKRLRVSGDVAGVRIPVLDQMQFGHGDQSQRQLGFRLVDANRLLLRFEATCFIGGNKTALGCTFVPVELRVAHGKAMLFAQEQALAALTGSLAPSDNLRWLFTARAVSKEDNLDANAILTAFNARIDSLHAALRQVSDGEPLSLLPHLTVPEHISDSDKKWLQPPLWQYVGYLLDRKPYDQAISVDAKADTRRREISAEFLTLEPCAVQDLFSADTPNGDDALPAQRTMGLRVIATFNRFTSTNGKPIEYPAVLIAPRFVDTDEAKASQLTGAPTFQPAVSEREPGEAVRGLVCGLRILDAQSGAQTRTLIGALQLGLAPAFPSDQRLAKNGTIDGLLRLLQYDDAVGQVPSAIEAKIKLPVAAAVPGGEDEVPEFAQPQSTRADHLADAGADPHAPMLMMLKPPSPASATLTLQAIESASRHASHAVQLTLSSTQRTTGPTTPPTAAQASASPNGLLLVVEPSPFRVAVVRCKDIAGNTGDESNVVAIWNAGADGLSWRIVDDAQTVSLSLPPQTIGEGMEKNRNTPDPDDPNKAVRPPDIAEDMPAACRFGSATRLDIDPSYFDARYVEPGWNLQRLFGYPGQRSPGATVRDLRAEFIYGMTTRLTPSLPDVRIAELGAVIGVPPKRLSADDTTPRVERAVDLFNTILRAQGERLAVDKIWSGDPLNEFSVQQDVRFKLRTEGLKTPFRWPLPGPIPADAPKTSAAESELFSDAASDGASFPGGVPWAFESHNILNSVYARPKSDGGSVASLHLSALGGWAKQRALFDEKRTIIATETTMGRVHRYALERIGRIGGLWNRAKHVIVYERSVLPSAPFYYIDPTFKQQDDLLGRPVLRKVEEYVELLEPVRRFPEKGTAVDAAGCLVGAEFVSRKIPVDSRWGGDIRNEGWQVPLWNKAYDLLPRSNDPDDPAFVYPKPHIRLLMMGESGAEKALEVDEPEKLFFYTSVVPGQSGDNTDNWYPVRDVDFIDLPLPSTGKATPRSGMLNDGMLPPEPRHVAGYERLTIGLVSSKDAVALAHGRQSGGPVALLHNVTIARAAPKTPSPASAPPPTAATVVQNVSERIVELRLSLDAQASKLSEAARAAAAKGYDTVDDAREQIKKQVRDAAKGVSDQIDAATQAFDWKPTPSKAPCEDHRNRLSAVFKSQLRHAQGQAIALVTNIVGAINAELDEVHAAVARIRTAGTDAKNWALAFLDGMDARAQDAARAADLAVFNTQSNAAGFLAEVAGAPDEIASALSITINGILQTLLDKLNAGGDPTIQIDGSVGQNAFVRRLVGNALASSSIAQNTRSALLVVDAACSKNEKDLNFVAGQWSSSPAEAKARVAAVIVAVNDAWKAAIADIDVDGARAVGPALSAMSRGVVHAVLDKLGAGGDADSLKSYVDSGLKQLYLVRQPVGSALAAASTSNLAQGVRNVLLVVDEALARAEAALRAAPINEPSVSNALASLTNLLNAFAKRASLAGPVGVVNGAIDALGATVHEEVAKASKQVRGEISGARDAVKNLPDAKVDEIANRVDQLAEVLMTAVGKIQTGVADTTTKALKSATDMQDQLLAAAAGVCADFEGKLNDLCNNVQNARDWVKNQLASYTDHIDQALDAISYDANEVIQNVQAAVTGVAREMEARANQALSTITQQAVGLLGDDDAESIGQAQRYFQQGSDTLRLIRAIGDPPKSDHLGFNRPEVAYAFQEASKLVDMTPAIALVNRVADTADAVRGAVASADTLLTSFGIRLPTSSLGDQLVPDALRNLDISRLFPDFSGIKLDGLFRNVGFPSLTDTDAIKVRHGFDQTELTLWLEADVDAPFDTSAPLMDFGPVQIVVDDACFTASARISEGRNGKQHSMHGQLLGDWRVVCAGQTILTFQQTALKFDESGHIDFDIQPNRVQLADELQFLTNLIEATGQEGGFEIVPYLFGSVPSGMAARLDMVLPPIQTGAFGISDLSLHLLFGVSALPEFQIVSELSVGAKLAPFTLNVWILNGGGFVTMRLAYLPMHRPASLLMFTLEIGIVAGIGLGFSFGVVSGGVWIQVGCAVAITWSTGGGGSTTAVTVFLLVRGNVDVAGIVTVGISLLLGVTYDGARMIAAGTLNLSIKISMFYTLSVSEHVEYTFAGEKKQSSNKVSYSSSYA